MTRLDLIKTMDEQTAGRYICNGIEDIEQQYACDFCPWTEMCGQMNGIVKWLKEEVKGEQNK